MCGSEASEVCSGISSVTRVQSVGKCREDKGWWREGPPAPSAAALLRVRPFQIPSCALPCLLFMDPAPRRKPSFGLRSLLVKLAPARKGGRWAVTSATARQMYNKH